MNEIITIERKNINGAEVNSVNSRDIYEYLEVNTEYPLWIKRVIDKYDFKYGTDFTIFKNEGRHGTKDYITTLNMAKELCMVSNTSKGKEVRKYFIEMENKYNNQVQIPKNNLEALSMFLEVSSEHESRLTKLEDTKRLENWQERSLHDTKNSKVYQIANDDKELANKLHRKVWSLFKKEFHLPRYNELPAIKYNDGISYINNLTLADMVG